MPPLLAVTDLSAAPASLESLLAQARALRFDAVDFIHAPDAAALPPHADSEDARVVRAWCDHAAIRPLALTVPLALRFPDDRAASRFLDAARRALALVHALDAPFLRLAAPCALDDARERLRLRDALRALAGDARRDGRALVFDPLPAPRRDARGGCAPPGAPELAAFHDAVDAADAFRLAWNPAASWEAASLPFTYAPEDAWTVLRGRVAYTHIASRRPVPTTTGGTVWTPPGEGVPDWPPLLRRMVADGYDGAFVFDGAPRRSTGAVPGADVTWPAFAGFMRGVLGGESEGLPS